MVAVVGTAAAFGAPACTAPPKESGLVLAVTTDLPVPTYVRQVGILVQYADRARNGRPLHSSRYAVRADGTIAIPATLGIGPAKNEGDRGLAIRISVVGYRVATSAARAIPSGDTSPMLEAFSIREVQTRIPENDTRLLRMPLDFMDTGSAATTPLGGTGTRAAGGLALQGTVEVPGVSVVSSDINRPCRPSDDDETTTTAVGGVCTPAVVDPSHLEAYSSLAQVEGGDARECFDTASCFAGAYVVPGAALRAVGAGGLDDPHRCIIDLTKIPGLPADTPKERLNLALDTTRTDEKKEVRGLIPLTHALVTVNGAPVAKDLAAIDPGFTYGNRTLEVPGELCEMVSALPIPFEKRKEATDDRKIERLLVSDRCRAKLAANPACSANTAGWSTAKITGEAPSDGGVDTGPIDTGPPPPPACKFTEVARHPIGNFSLLGYSGGVNRSWFLVDPNPGVDAPYGVQVDGARVNAYGLDGKTRIFGNDQFVVYDGSDIANAPNRELNIYEVVTTASGVRPALPSGVTGPRPIAPSLFDLAGTRIVRTSADGLFEMFADDNQGVNERAWLGGSGLRFGLVAAAKDSVYTVCSASDAKICRVDGTRGTFANAPVTKLTIPGLPAVPKADTLVYGVASTATANDAIVLVATGADLKTFGLFFAAPNQADGTSLTRLDPTDLPFVDSPYVVRASQGFALYYTDVSGPQLRLYKYGQSAPFFVGSPPEIKTPAGIVATASDVRVAQVVGTDAVVYALPIPCTP